ncbi:AGE family epimerase/isomerase [Myxosarcina sp. GI1]|uniref:AGE family epimerase/isomerase n=1 Tax=Myxosarcina sp. GI1 TaxID=1541065 RepID=UPI0005687492|nr:AGE family epimerase/isomerase [Myxosarcina sp. GI1]
MNKLDFCISDLIAGYVTEFDPDRGDSGTFKLQTSDKRDYEIELTDMTYAQLVRNLGEPYQDCTFQMKSMLVPGRYLFVYGIFYPDVEDIQFVAKQIVFLGRSNSEYLFEKPDWWIKQIKQLADFYLKSQFDDGEINYDKYRTSISLMGAKDGSTRQETDTISRLVYGFASAYMLTGEERYLEAAEKGTEYLHDNMRFLDESEEICYWYHGVDIMPDGSKQKVFASEFGDDRHAIPAYEQIYALAGPTQTYRVTGDVQIKHDLDLTINLFDRYFLDKTEHGGFFSHIDPITLSPHCPTLGPNRAKKNWNSIGDHAPAFLINMYLATGEQRCADFLEYTFDLIEKHFPCSEASPFVQERFNQDWTPDKVWGWQQDRAVVGHNLKIAWNIMRMYHLNPKEKYTALAEKIARIMPAVGSDCQRGGWYDVVERTALPNHKHHRHVWHDRKAWWQQEQAILAYLILAGSTGNCEFRKQARESAAFYNAWFLDNEDGGIYFNVLANGIPYLIEGNERGKGSHSMSGYHSFELAYLATVYINLLLTNKPMDLYFKPKPNGFKDNILRIQPDILPAGSIEISAVWLNERPFFDFDAANLTINLPTDLDEMRFKVRVMPTKVPFDANLVEVTDERAEIILKGTLDQSTIWHFQEVLERATVRSVKYLMLEMSELENISSEGIRALAFNKQQLGDRVQIYLVRPTEAIKQLLEKSSFCDDIQIVDRVDSPEMVGV